MGSALFANQRESNLASTVALVEAVLGDLGHDVAQSRLGGDDGLHAWQVRKGSALTRISLVSRTEFTHLRVCSTVMTVDGKVDRAALNAHLLELNAGLCGAAFASEGDHVLLLAERSTLDLDRAEVRELIKRVTTYADDHDDALVARFGGKMGAG
ncbi:MAG TPA: YbjN domain-containing protein [Kofleriaceae bacterium]|nr:YbjN domain-containing protein [Kofleriaceae bacterium]